MKFKFILFISIILFTPIFAFAANAGDIVFTEIAYDLKGADDGHEWVEIHNTGANEIDITGWKFNDGANHLLNAPPKNGGQGAMIISAGGYAVLAGDAILFLTDHPDFSGTVIDTAMSLNNTSATLTILDNDGIVIDSVTYQKESGANGNGMTLEKSGSLWKESAQAGGTPGAVNGNASSTGTGATGTEPLLPPQLQSSASQPPSLTADAGENIVAVAGEDVLFDGSKSKGAGLLNYWWNFGDGTVKEGEQVLHKYLFPGVYIVTLRVSDGLQSQESQSRADVYANSVNISEFLPNPPEKENEWVELANQSSDSVDISGWGLGAEESAPLFKIPENTFLSGNGFLVLSKSATKLSLSDSNGSVYLFYPNGQIAGKVEYKGARQNMSASLTPGGRFVWTEQRTPGAKNITISSAVPEKNIESSNVEFNDKASAAAVKTKSLFVEYSKYNGVKSFIAEPAFAYAVDETGSTSQNTGGDYPAGTALSYGAFSRSWLAVISAAGAVLLFLLFKKIKSGTKS